MQDWVRLGRGGEKTELQKRWEVIRVLGRFCKSS